MGILEGKVAIVTGAGRGIGRAIAMAMALEGAKVVVNDVGDEGRALAAVVVKDIQNAGGEAIENADSVATQGGAEAIIAVAINAWDKIDAVVNNAGIINNAPFYEMSHEDFDAVLKVNLYGSYNVSRAAVPFFKQQAQGVFIHMTSSVGLIGSPGLAGYAASKFGIAGLSRSISFDMQKFNVRSNCIAPAAFTRMTTTGSNDPAHVAYADWARANMRAEQVAPLAVFLVSDAAGSISGQIFGVRADELYLYNQPRPIRTLHRDGWTAQQIARQLPQTWRSAFVPHETTSDVLSAN
jgi:NAD(P)-dependent dehydrogenase (short-subunit alcohol dehydrogenase family)